MPAQPDEQDQDQDQLDVGWGWITAYANNARRLLLLDPGKRRPAAHRWPTAVARVEAVLDHALALVASAPPQAHELRCDAGVSGDAAAQFWEIPSPHGPHALAAVRDLLDASPATSAVHVDDDVLLILDFC